jgi:hypothetical protein
MKGTQHKVRPKALSADPNMSRSTHRCTATFGLMVFPPAKETMLHFYSGKGMQGI